VVSNVLKSVTNYRLVIWRIICHPPNGLVCQRNFESNDS